MVWYLMSRGSGLCVSVYWDGCKAGVRLVKPVIQHMTN